MPGVPLSPELVRRLLRGVSLGGVIEIVLAGGDPSQRGKETSRSSREVAIWFGDLVHGNSLTTPIFHNRNSISTPKDLLLTSAPTKLGLGCKKPTPPSYFFGA